MGYGDYPRGYKPSIHGYYDPAVYYGKPDTPFGDVKLKNLRAWFSRRNKSPFAMLGACSRAWWRWQHNYLQPKKHTAAPFYQIILVSMTFFYLINYSKIRQHRNYKYH